MHSHVATAALMYTKNYIGRDPKYDSVLVTVDVTAAVGVIAPQFILLVPALAY